MVQILGPGKVPFVSLETILKGQWGIFIVMSSKCYGNINKQIIINNGNSLIGIKVLKQSC